MSRTVRLAARSIACLAAFAVAMAWAAAPAGAGPLPNFHLELVALCDECGDPDLPEPCSPPGDAEVEVILQALCGQVED